jgi:hypothetical protein
LEIRLLHGSNVLTSNKGSQLEQRWVMSQSGYELAMDDELFSTETPAGGDSRLLIAIYGSINYNKSF